ncbi:MAG: hypothetical protein FWE82_00715 [Defluviitaleaceae bacterium]|nr:hypothetical protein [Defluviitaleaceae bacterium]
MKNKMKNKMIAAALIFSFLIPFSLLAATTSPPAIAPADPAQNETEHEPRMPIGSDAYVVDTSPVSNSLLQKPDASVTEKSPSVKTEFPAPIISERPPKLDPSKEMEQYAALVREQTVPLLPLAPPATDGLDYSLSIVNMIRTNVNVIFTLQLDAHNGKFIGPYETADFDVVSIVDGKGEIFYQNPGKAAYWYGVKFFNNSPENAERLTALLVMSIHTFDYFSDGYLTFQGLSVYEQVYENAEWNVSEFLRANRTLNTQRVRLIKNSWNEMYEEPKIESKNLGIELAENIDFTIENIFIKDEFLFIRTDHMTLADYNFTVMQNDVCLEYASDQYYKGYEEMQKSLCYKIADLKADIKISWFMYNKYYDYQNYRWMLPIANDFPLDPVVKTVELEIKVPGTELTVHELSFHKSSYTLKYTLDYSLYETGSLCAFLMFDQNAEHMNAVSVTYDDLLVYATYTNKDGVIPENLLLHFINYDTGAETYAVFTDLNGAKPSYRLLKDNDDFQKFIGQMFEEQWIR